MTDNCEIDVESMEVQEVLPNSAVEVVTNCSSTDLEVGGGIVTSNDEETITESRRVSDAKEESAQEKLSRRRSIEKTVVWKAFKSLVFFISLICLIIQSVEFLTNYYKYPTTTELETTIAEDFKLPAITLCFRNTMSYQTFCSSKPNRCEPPSNIEEFCWKRPYDLHCWQNKSNVKIPMRDTLTRNIMQDYLFNDSYNDARLFWDYKYASKVRTFVRDIDKKLLFLKCYSQNLHLFQSGSKPETIKLQFDSELGDLVSSIVLDQMEIGPFYPKDKPQVFVAIHSPYLPIGTKELHAIMPGTGYIIGVQLAKEEHLLPPPYQTNCRDNGPSKDAKDSTSPNSHQMCLELCRSEHEKTVYGCDWGMTMISTVRDLCYGVPKERKLPSEQEDELKKKRLICFRNCKQGCLKIHYKCTIKEIDITDIPNERYRSRIWFNVKNPEVTVLRHVPLYGSGDIFSHIGGLLGCWLGVSVFTFTDILEKFFWKVVGWKKRFKKRRITLKRFRKRRFTLRRFRKTRFTLRRLRKGREQRAPQTSEIHQD